LICRHTDSSQIRRFPYLSTSCGFRAKKSISTPRLSLVGPRIYAKTLATHPLSGIPSWKQELELSRTQFPSVSTQKEFSTSCG
jgi:hypothetical protein